MQSPLTKILCLTFNKRTEKTLNVTAGKQSLRQTCWRTYSPPVAGNHGAATSGTLSSCWWPGWESWTTCSQLGAPCSSWPSLKCHGRQQLMPPGHLKHEPGSPVDQTTQRCWFKQAPDKWVPDKKKAGWSAALLAGGQWSTNAAQPRKTRGKQVKPLAASVQSWFNNDSFTPRAYGTQVHACGQTLKK